MNLNQKLRSICQRARQDMAVYRRVLRHPKTPRLARWCVGLAVAYLLTPIDLIPDFIPVLGQLDDVVIVPMLVLIARRTIPAEVWADCRPDRTSSSSSL